TASSHDLVNPIAHPPCCKEISKETAHVVAHSWPFDVSGCDAGSLFGGTNSLFEGRILERDWTGTAILSCSSNAHDRRGRAQRTGWKEGGGRGGMGGRFFPPRPSCLSCPSRSKSESHAECDPEL